MRRNGAVKRGGFKIIGLREGCSLFRVNHSSASRNFRCTACQKQPHPTPLHYW